jgi:4-aminobutyrate aminotransferase / (S)-3-amino-2-methylpropionate transaminase / 5-aminovalerate transaminase
MKQLKSQFSKNWDIPTALTDEIVKPNNGRKASQSGSNEIKRSMIAEKKEMLKEIDKDYMSWGDTVHYMKNPVIAKRAEKEIVYDIDENKYIDVQMWHSSCNFGYNNQEIQKPVADQLFTLPQVSGDMLHEEKLILAKEISDAIYERIGVRGRVSFNVSGTLAVEDAIKIVRKNTGKNKIGVFQGAYHGRSITCSGMSSSSRYRKHYGHIENAHMFPYAACTNCIYDKTVDSCGLYCAKMINKSFDTDFYGVGDENESELGALFMEIVQGRGYTVPPKGFFKEFVPEMQKKGILIVADEIQSGMFRTGKMFAFEHYGITPDIITLSKSLTNGLAPLSAVWAREDLVSPEVFTPGHAHSNFANHILGTTAALATWKYMKNQNYEQSLKDKGGYLLNGLQKLQEKYHFIKSVDGLGFMLNMNFADEKNKPYKELGHIVQEIAQDNEYEFENEKYRMILNSGGYWANAIKIAPYLDSTYDELDRIISILDQILAKTKTYLEGQNHA